MFDLVLTLPADEGTREIVVEERISFGRGSGAECRFEDNGLSRLHATICREGDQVWIVDENSSNGTFVNGEGVPPSGTPLSDGDRIRIGHETDITVEFRSAGAPAAEDSGTDALQTVESSDSESEEPASMLLPVVILMFAVLIIGASAIFIGFKVMGSGNSGVVSGGDTDYTADLGDTDDPGYEDPQTQEGTDVGTKTATTGSPDGPAAGETTVPITDSPRSNSEDTRSGIPAGKTYQQMSEPEKNQYVKVKAEIVSRIIGNSRGESIPPAAVAKIRYWLDGYVRRIRKATKNDCTGKGWLSSDMTSVLMRAKENAPFIIRAFNKQGIDPQVGLYLAMIESEHCECLQSSTGPLGMFQFTRATGKLHGLDTKSGASPANPDERCFKEPAARAAASYMKSLTGRIGTGPLSIPLAIASYNSGEGGLGKNLRTALEANESQERSFWTLVANSEKLAKQFQKENIKYVPKFFAAAIIGENPKDFGVNMLPLSVYTR